MMMFTQEVLEGYLFTIVPFLRCLNFQILFIFFNHFSSKGNIIVYVKQITLLWKFKDIIFLIVFSLLLNCNHIQQYMMLTCIWQTIHACFWWEHLLCLCQTIIPCLCYVRSLYHHEIDQSWQLLILHNEVQLPFWIDWIFY